MNRCKKFMAVLLTFVMILSFGSFVFGEESDIANHWAKEEIQYLISKNIVSGYPDGSFKPDRQITRAEFVKIINYIFGYSEKGSVSFTDVKEGDWFYDEIAKAVKAGYISGYDDGTMKPNSPITRQEVSKIMGMVFDLDENEEPADGFVDADQIGDWAKGYVGILKDKGYISGYPDGSFKPGNPITRAESVKVVTNASGTIINAEGEYSEDAVGNVLVNTSGVVLKDMKIAGDLYLVEGIGEGDVTLDNVTVKGSTYIRGGGEDSIVIINSETGQIFVKKAEGNVRLVLEGVTDVSSIVLGDNGKLTIKEGAKIGSIKVIGECSIEIEKGAEVDKIEVEAEGAEIESEGTVNSLIATEEVKVNGKLVEKDKELKIEDGKAEEVKEEKPKEPKPSGSSGPSEPDPVEVAKSALAGRVLDKINETGQVEGTAKFTFDKGSKTITVNILDKYVIVASIRATDALVKLAGLEEIRGYKIGDTTRDFYGGGNRKSNADIKSWLITDAISALGLGDSSTALDLENLVGKSFTVEVYGKVGGVGFTDIYRFNFIGE